ncbi:MAG: ACT domain-containing protein [Ignavibacteriaceae bacterium]
MIIKQLSVFLEDKIGRLTEITKILADNNINISAFSIADAADYGILRLIVNKPVPAVKALKDNNFSVNTTDVVCMVVPHEPGGLYKALQLLSSNNITIDYMYAFAMEKTATVVIRSSSNEDVIRILQENKMTLLKASDVYEV